MTKNKTFYISHHFPSAVRDKDAPEPAAFYEKSKKVYKAPLPILYFSWLSHALIHRSQMRRIQSCVFSPRRAFIPFIQPSIFSISSPQQTRVPPPASNTTTTFPQTLQRYFSPSASTTMSATFHLFLAGVFLEVFISGKRKSM
jgi:hypothetical protein